MAQAELRSSTFIDRMKRLGCFVCYVAPNGKVRSGLYTGYPESLSEADREEAQALRAALHAAPGLTELVAAECRRRGLVA